MENKELKAELEMMRADKEQMMRDYNREISDLKSNLRNSVFEEDNNQDFQCPPEEMDPNQTKTMTFAPATENKLA
jgi:hypothetical protein